MLSWQISKNLEAPDFAHIDSLMLLCNHWQIPVPGLYDGPSFRQHVYGKSFDDSEPYLTNNKLANKARGLSDNNLLKSFSVDKEKASNVAKIKVVVCSFGTISIP